MSVTLGTLIIAVIVLAIAAVAVGGGVYDLCRQRVVVDQNTRQVVHIEIPLFGKIKSNYPSVAAIFLGAVIVWLVVDWIDVEIKKIPLTASIKVLNHNLAESKKADIFLSVIPQEFNRSRSGVNTNDTIKIKMDVDKGKTYDVIVHSPVFTRPNGTTERVMEFGSMRIETIDGIEMGLFEAELIIK